MSHARTQVRNAAVATLGSALGEAATVYTSRILPLEQGDLPAVLVYANEEAIQEQEFGGLERVLSLIVETVAQAADLDAAFDPILVSVEQALNGTTFDELVARCVPTGLEITMSAEGAAPIGRARMTYEVTYCTSLADPETTI